MPGIKRKWWPTSDSCECHYIADHLGKHSTLQNASWKGFVRPWKLTDDDFRQITRLRQLKMLSLSNGLNDERFSQLTALVDLEYLQTNPAQVSDQGSKPLAQLKKLKTLKFFHPGKSFSGAGLVHLAKLPSLQSLTVAGSLAFNDDGMAAVARLTGLKEFRTWHAGGTDEGVKYEYLKAWKSA